MNVSTILSTDTEQEEVQRKEAATTTYSLVVFGVLADHVSEQSDTVVDGAAVLLLDEVVHLALVARREVVVVVHVLSLGARGKPPRLEEETGRRRGVQTHPRSSWREEMIAPLHNGLT